MRKGNVSLRRCLSQAAWAISMTKNNYLVALYRRVAGRRGAKRAVMAVAHTGDCPYGQSDPREFSIILLAFQQA